MSTWVGDVHGGDFPLEQLPYGIFSASGSQPRGGVAIGDFVLDLSRLPRALLPGAEVFAEPTLNSFLAEGRRRWTDVRETLTGLLRDPAARPEVEPALLVRDTVSLHLPIEVADYVDFYSSQQHATNVGRIFRPDGEPLSANWKHLPVGYHGRAGTVVVSGTPVRRPAGQHHEQGASAPEFGPSSRLDIEAEVGFVVGTPSQHGRPVAIDDAEEHLFGVVLLNDWSARDLQAWETVPLGPFLSKSFATSVSAWVTPLDALRGARCRPPEQEPAPLPYLQATHPWGLDLRLEVEINGTVVSRPPFATTYWTPAQQLAHLTVNGASLRTGDLYASGTVSGPARAEWGSLLELTANGVDPIVLGDSTSRSFLQDGDTVRIRASVPDADGPAMWLGEVVGTVLPSAG
jgi:fumarylacetoacetase